VEPEERESFVREGQAGWTSGVCSPTSEPGGERDVYFPLALVAPSNAANRDVIDRDEYTDPAHRAAMDRARDTGSPRATEIVYVLTGPPPGSEAGLALQSGFAVYLPVYGEGERTETVAERRRALEGFVVGYFRRDGLLDDVFGGGFEPAIDFEVYDGKEVSSSSLLYDYDGVERATDEGYEPMFSEENRIGVAGRGWTLYFATLSRFEEGAESNLPAFVLASGIGVSLLLFGISWMLVRSRVLAERASKDLEDANRELEGTNRELEAFSYSVSHDLRAPLRTIDGFSQILQEDYEDKLDEEGVDYLGRVRAASKHMADLIDDLLDLSRVGRRPLSRERVDLSGLVAGIVEDLRMSEPERQGGVRHRRERRGLGRHGPPQGGAREPARQRLEVHLAGARGAHRVRGQEDAGRPVYFVRDNGAGFDQAYSDKLSGPSRGCTGRTSSRGPASDWRRSRASSTARRQGLGRGKGRRGGHLLLHARRHGPVGPGDPGEQGEARLRRRGASPGKPCGCCWLRTRRRPGSLHRGIRRRSRVCHREPEVRGRLALDAPAGAGDRGRAPGRGEPTRVRCQMPVSRLIGGSEEAARLRPGVSREA
jgi:signal transduction histidine kinase